MSSARRHVAFRRRRRYREPASHPRGVDRAARQLMETSARVELVTRLHPAAIVPQQLQHVRLLAPVVMVAWGSVGIDQLRTSPIGGWLLVACWTAAAFLLCRMALAVVQWECQRVVITSEHIMVQRGAVSRRVAAMPLAAAGELAVRRTLTGRLLGYGTVIIDTPRLRSGAQFTLRYIADPGRVSRCIADAVRALESMSAQQAGVSGTLLVPQSLPVQQAPSMAAPVTGDLGDVVPRIGDTIQLPAIRTATFDE